MGRDDVKALSGAGRSERPGVGRDDVKALSGAGRSERPMHGAR